MSNFMKFLMPFVFSVIGIFILFLLLNTFGNKSNNVYIQETTTESGILCIVATKGDFVSLACNFNDYE